MCIVSNTYHIVKVHIECVSYGLLTASSQPYLFEWEISGCWNLPPKNKTKENIQKKHTNLYFFTIVQQTQPYF